jgi:hypothetical protein
MIVEFVLSAEVELDEAVAYFEAQRKGLGTEFAREVSAAILRIVEHPNAWQKLTGGVRRCQLNRFEYGVVYGVQDDVTTIYAVMHLRRRPGYWRDRLKSSSED